MSKTTTRVIGLSLVYMWKIYRLLLMLLNPVILPHFTIFISRHVIIEEEKMATSVMKDRCLKLTKLRS